jgi:thiol-disulfide isomerase/thioredoxin
MDTAFLKAKFEASLPYDQYVRSGTDAQYDNWKKVYDQVKLTADQQKLVGSFVRQINVLVMSGIWCGDCVQQCPIIERIGEANPQKIAIRWADRDIHADLQEKLVINGGHRVPVVVFMAEDFTFAGWFGDRTLGRYRALAARQLGPSCPLPGAPLDPNELVGQTQEWVDQFERIHLMLRLSTRLRQKYND